MTKILFVCLGNICRSPMAEFVFRDLVEKRGLSGRFQAVSAATSAEEAGNPVHPGTRRRLAREGISVQGKRAVQMTPQDYAKYHLLIGMEERNLAAMRRISGGDPQGKIRRLLDFSSHPRDIADPWYTGDFDRTYDDILEGCQALLDYLLKEPGTP
jgi:protein-tyrosine phosphatase